MMVIGLEEMAVTRPVKWKVDGTAVWVTVLLFVEME